VIAYALAASAAVVGLIGVGCFLRLVWILLTEED
jgi:hypothetical protein